MNIVELPTNESYYEPRWPHSGKPPDIGWPLWDHVVGVHRLEVGVSVLRCICGWATGRSEHLSNYEWQKETLDSGRRHRAIRARELVRFVVPE